MNMKSIREWCRAVYEVAASIAIPCLIALLGNSCGRAEGSGWMSAELKEERPRANSLVAVAHAVVLVTAGPLMVDQHVEV